MRRSARKRIELDNGVTIKDARAVRRTMGRAIKHGRFAGDVVQDIDEERRGVRTNKRKKRFWQKKGVQNAALAHALTIGTVLAIANKDKIAKTFGGGKAKAPRTSVGSNGEHAFDIPMEKGWYMTKPTSSSVRVHTSGKRKKRRPKKSWETIAWARRAAAIGALAAGVGIPTAYVVGKRKGAANVNQRRKRAIGTPVKPKDILPPSHQKSVAQTLTDKPLHHVVDTQKETKVKSVKD